MTVFFSIEERQVHGSARQETAKYEKFGGDAKSYGGCLGQ
jgi:hypothetical protein